MSLYNKIINREEKVSLIGLGYVGMPIAVAFARKINVIGFDLNKAKIDLYKSHPTKFLITEKGLLPPIASLAGVGNTAALAIAAARDANNPFISREDLRLRAGIGKSVIEHLAEVGILDQLPESNQIDLF